MSLAPHSLIALILDLFDQCVDGLLSEGIFALLADPWCGGKCENPLRKIWKSVGVIIPNIWKNKRVPNHQPDGYYNSPMNGKKQKPIQKPIDPAEMLTLSPGWSKDIAPF